MTTNSDNILEFPTDVRAGMKSITANIENASRNLRHSAEILRLHGDMPPVMQRPIQTTQQTLDAAKKVSKEAKSITRQINLLSSNLLK